MKVNMEYYKIFYYVGKYGGISAAAEVLCISQPAVSQAIKQLETALSATLFIRKSKGIQFTAQGQMLYSYVKQGYEYIELGENKLQEMLNLESGEIRIGASDMTLQFYLLSYLETFHENYPNIKFFVTNGPTPETIKNLEEGKIDFAVITEPFDSKDNITGKRVQKIQDVFVAGAGFSTYKNKKLPLSTIGELPVICLEKNTSSRRYVDEFLQANQVVMKPEFEIATSDMIVQFSRKNLGVGCVVKDFAREYLDSGELFELQFAKKIPNRYICIATNNRIPVSNAAAKLLEML